MRHYSLVTILSAVAVVGLLVQITGATAYNFDENTADGNGGYLLDEANNWYEYFSPSSRAVPGSTDTAHIAYGRTCILDGTTEEVSALGIGEQSNYAATDTGTLTIRSGSLTTGDARIVRRARRPDPADAKRGVRERTRSYGNVRHRTRSYEIVRDRTSTYENVRKRTKHFRRKALFPQHLTISGPVCPRISALFLSFW